MGSVWHVRLIRVTVLSTNVGPIDLNVTQHPLPSKPHYYSPPVHHPYHLLHLQHLLSPYPPAPSSWAFLFSILTTCRFSVHFFSFSSSFVSHITLSSFLSRFPFPFPVNLIALYNNNPLHASLLSLKEKTLYIHLFVVTKMGKDRGRDGEEEKKANTSHISSLPFNYKIGQRTNDNIIIVPPHPSSPIPYTSKLQTSRNAKTPP